MKDKCKAFFAKPFFHDYRTLLGLWLLLGVLAAVMKMHSHNNFLIFRGVFSFSLRLPLCQSGLACCYGVWLCRCSCMWLSVVPI